MTIGLSSSCFISLLPVSDKSFEEEIFTRSCNILTSLQLFNLLQSAFHSVIISPGSSTKIALKHVTNGKTYCINTLHVFLLPRMSTSLLSMRVLFLSLLSFLNHICRFLFFCPFLAQTLELQRFHLYPTGFCRLCSQLCNAIHSCEFNHHLYLADSQNNISKSNYLP